MAQGKKKKLKTEVLKKESSDILDLEKTIQKDISVDDLSLKKMVDKSVDSVCADLFTSGTKSAKKQPVKDQSVQEPSVSKLFAPELSAPERPAPERAVPERAAPESSVQKEEVQIKEAGQKREPESAFALTLSNHLKIAEKKIKELEQNNEDLRLDNEKLLVAGEALKEAADKFSNENKAMKSNYKEEKLSWADQKNDLENKAEDQSAEIESLKMKIGVLEKHLSRDIKKTRVRERELENRLELKQNEMESVIREKDQTLLKFKQELDFLREKEEQSRNDRRQWVEQRVQDKDRKHRAVQSLQLSLKLLEENSEKDFSLEEKSELFEKPPEMTDVQEAGLNKTASSPLAEGEESEDDPKDQNESEKEDESSKMEESAG